MRAVSVRIRDYARDDQQSLVELSLRAWEPVFLSLQQVLGVELFDRLRGDWRQGQAADVRGVLGDDANRAWVAEANEALAGFVTATLHPATGVGEIPMLAVDPRCQRRGVGAALTDVATEWLRQSGMRVAMVETGGDPGHLPARRTYEAAGYTKLPVTRYFRAL